MRPLTFPDLAGRRDGARPTLAVWKFASCDGCQLSLLDCERELLDIAERVTIASFPEASSAVIDGPYDLSLVEGSISTPADVERIERIRSESRLLVTIGACATSGGIQALRNGADIDEFVSIVYAEPTYIDTLADSAPIADHVAVDVELRGCPIDRRQLIELIDAVAAGRPLRIPTTSVCTECKRRGVTCVMVAHGAPCLGPVTQTGCGAVCPRFERACYGCFGPAETANAVALDEQFAELGVTTRDRRRIWTSFTGWSPEFRPVTDRLAITDRREESG